VKPMAGSIGQVWQLLRLISMASWPHRQGAFLSRRPNNSCAKARSSSSPNRSLYPPAALISADRTARNTTGQPTVRAIERPMPVADISLAS
jgi:hypothetical protein